ncbi:MAG: hypothetical protein Fur0011_3440 [Candidatus Microgenomates bacterium]
MCQACGRAEHEPDGFMRFAPEGGSEITVNNVRELLEANIIVSPYAVMLAFGSKDAAIAYVEGQGFTFDESMLS